MSHSAPPPNQPYGQHSAGTPGAPPSHQGWNYAQPGAQGYATAPSAAPAQGSVGLGLAAAFGTALVAAGVYGAIIGFTKHEIGWAAVGVGFVIGLAGGKAGGRSIALAIMGAVFSLGAVYLGQMVGEAMIGAKQTGIAFTELFFQHFGLVHEAWKSDSDPLTFLFFALAAFAAFSGSKKAAA